VGRSDASLGEAEDAYERGDYATAQRLFRAALSEMTDEQTATLARYREAECALELGAFDEALESFRRLESSSDSEIAVRARSMVGLTHYRRGDYAAARDVWAKVVREVEDAKVASEAQFAMGWCAVRLGDFATAGEAFRRVVLLFPDSVPAQRARAMLERLDEASSLPLRSARTARLLSTFLPGAGQVYAGRVGNGSVSFVLNGVVAYALTRSLVRGRWLDAAFVFALGSRFYFGGRQNAGRFAAEWNQRQRDALIERWSSLEP